MEKVYSLFAEKGYVSPNDDGVMAESDSISIQNAVNLALESGVGKVIIPRYNKRCGTYKWILDETIFLRSNITIVLDDCLLEMADDVYANFFRTDNVYRDNGPFTEEEYRNIVIMGVGSPVLEGGKANDLNESVALTGYYPPANFNTPILLYNVRGFSVENLRIRNHRYWGILLAYCKEGRVRDVQIEGYRDRRNQDGINLRNGCNNILLENISGQSGDDMIALSAIDVEIDSVKYNAVIPGWDNDIHDVMIRNISGCALGHPLIALRNSDGKKIYNISIENVSDTPANVSDYWEKFVRHTRYAMIRIGNNYYFQNRSSIMGETSNISIRNIFARYSERAITVNATLKNSRFSDIHCTGNCGAAVSINPIWAGEPGAKIENLIIDGLFFSPDRTYERTEPKFCKKGIALDFNVQRSHDYIKNLILRNAVIENAHHVASLSGDTRITMEGIVTENLLEEAVWINPDSVGQVCYRYNGKDNKN